MNSQINDFLKYQKSYFKDIATFKKTELCKFYESFFGELKYTEDTEVCFIGVDKNGWFYDEIYYPHKIKNKVGTLAPEIFIKNKTTPDPIWRDVSTKGYAIIEDCSFNNINKNLIINDTYFKYNYKPEFNIHETMLMPFYAENIQYEELDKHFEPPYITAIREEAVERIKKTNPNLFSHSKQTSDLVKYVFLPDLPESSNGPYSFHYDYFSGLNFMFFIYLAKEPKIEGRELLIGKRPDYTDFKADFVYDKIKDKNLMQYDKIQIKDNMIVIINSLNPIFYHAIERMKSDNEVFLITNYLWNKIK